MFASLLIATLMSVPAAQDLKPEAKVLPAAEARNHLDETATVELKVQLTKNGEPQRTYFLDSEADYKDPKNLAILISYDHEDAFKAAGIDDPSTYYLGKTIRVTGKIVKEGTQTRIHVESPKAITLVEKTKLADPS